MNKDIHICFCSDENLIEHIPTVLNSIQSKNAHHTIIIHFIHCIMNLNLLEQLQQFINNFKNMKLHCYYKTWDYNYEGLNHVSSATMLRLFIPDLIQVSKIIYLDIDLIVQLDLQLLSDFDCGETGIALKESIDKPNNHTILQFDTSKSGNCGVMVMDLDILRNNNFTQKCLELHTIYGGHDQFVINKYAEGKYSHLPARFNVFLDKDDFFVEIKTGFILHYVGKHKPYNEPCKYDFLWNKFRTIHLIDYSFINFIDKVVYINLEHRTDRKYAIEKELALIPKEKIVRFPGIYNAQHGGIGCTKSHIEVLKMAIRNNWKNYIVIEDDATWNNCNGSVQLKNLLQNSYDVILLGHINARYNAETFKLDYATTTTSYLVSNHYYKKLLNNFQEGLNYFIQTNIYKNFAIDQYWLSLMKEDNWYCVAPSMFIQRPDFSDIIKKEVNYTIHFT